MECSYRILKLALESLFEPSHFIKEETYTLRKPNNLAKVLQQSGSEAGVKNLSRSFHWRALCSI